MVLIYPFYLLPMEKLPATAFAVSFVLLLALFGCAGAPINHGVAADGHPYRGSAGPKVIVYEYSDFECPYCAAVQPTVEQVLRAYPNDVQLQYRYFPLPIHPRAQPSAIAGVCATKQGKFWEMHDRMFANQQALEDSDLRNYASQVGMNLTQFDSCYSSKEAADAVAADQSAGVAAGVVSTPTFIVGGSKVIGSQPFSKFKQAIDSEIALVK